MDRLNLTLDPSISSALTKHARREGKPRAAMARELIREAMTRREALERRRRLARDYASSRDDALEILADLEASQVELFDDEP